MGRLRTALLVLVLAAAVGTSAVELISVARCCQLDDQVYSFGDARCVDGDAVGGSAWPPPIYQTAGELSDVAAGQGFRDSIAMVECRNGTVASSSRHFKLFVDGTLRLEKQDGGRVLEAGQFCVERSLADKDPAATNFIARFCVPDPCEAQTCVRKCCPEGYALDLGLNTLRCTFHEVEFDFNFSNETGHEESTKPSYAISSSMLECPDTGINLIHPSMVSGDKFHILYNGSLYIPDYPKENQYEQNYCIDEHIEPYNSSSFGVVALTCFPKVQEFITLPWLLFTSSTFLIATFVVYVSIGELRNNHHGLTVMGYTASMAVSYIFIGILQIRSDLSYHMPEVCVGMAIVTHFCFLATFTWLNVMSFEIWLSFSQVSRSVNFWLDIIDTQHNGSNAPRPLENDTTAIEQSQPSSSTIQATDSINDDMPSSNDDKSDFNDVPNDSNFCGLRTFLYCSYAWGIPFLIVAAGQILDKVPQSETLITPTFGATKCWFSDDYAHFVYLYGPIAVLLVVNITFFVLTSIRLMKTSERHRTRNRKHNFCLIFVLFFVMGISWTLEFISWAVGGYPYFWIVTDVINICLGIFIFALFVCRKSIRNLISRKYRAFCR